MCLFLIAMFSVVNRFCITLQKTLLCCFTSEMNRPSQGYMTGTTLLKYHNLQAALMPFLSGRPSVSKYLYQPHSLRTKVFLTLGCTLLLSLEGKGEEGKRSVLEAFSFFK